MTELAVALSRDGYLALPRAWHRSPDPEGDVMECRLLGTPALVVRGGHGARTFYDETLVERHGAVPPPLASLIFGSGAVHGLDGNEHRSRKALFVSAVSADGVAQLGEEVRASCRRWSAPGRRRAEPSVQEPPTAPMTVGGSSGHAGRSWLVTGRRRR